MKYSLLLTLSLASLLTLNPAFAADNTETLAAETNEVATDFGKRLGKTMQEAMQSGGPVSGVRVCSDSALKIAGEISRKTGWKVTRVGTKVRNTLIGIPDEWENSVLAQFEQRHASGKAYDGMSHSEIVDEGGKKYFRLMRAIEVKPGCLQCHGDKDTMLPEVEMILDEIYPHDGGRGFKAGDLRGAVSIKRPL